MKRRGGPAPEADSVERRSVTGSRERWLDLFQLEHATLPLARDVSGDAGELIVFRPRPPGRPVSRGRIPASLAPALFLQAAAALSFYQAHGFCLHEEDLGESSWDLEDGTARLWLAAAPAAVRGAGPRANVCTVLASFLDRLFSWRRRLTDPGARAILDRFGSADSGDRRPEFWVAETLRAFPHLGGAEAGGARVRTLGSAGAYSKPATRRALLEKARAVIDGRVPRVFRPGSSTAAPGGALELEDMGLTAGLRTAVRALRERHAREASARRARWIAVDPERWDPLSRRAFETAAHCLGDEVEVVIVPSSTAPPLLADEWRREIFVPCGTLAASLRFYERFAELARSEPSCAWRLAGNLVRASGWARFVTDPTGEAPLPQASEEEGPPSSSAGRALDAETLAAMEIASRPVTPRELASALLGRPVRSSLERLRRAGWAERDSRGLWRPGPRQEPGEAEGVSASRRQELCRRWAPREKDPCRRVELLLDGGETAAALEQARRAIPDPTTRGQLERWFGITALLSCAVPAPLPIWLEALEAEREAAGGRFEDAETRLSRLESAAGLEPAGRARIRLRLAEIAAERGRWSEAGQRASVWREEFRGAPADQVVRALVVEALDRARRGEHDRALTLLDEADRAAERLPLADRLEAALARAGVYSRAGRFHEEDAVYERWRSIVRESGDELLRARVLSRQALGLADRRQFAAAVARLEEALATSSDDPVESARLSINLASTLYRSGRRSRCRELLDDAIRLATSVGREDLAGTALANRLKLTIDAGDWEAASRDVQILFERASAEGDRTRLLFALHHRSRLALRRGRLREAAEDNARARALAESLRDRLETGELLLEDGDRLLYEGDLAAAQAAWEAAAADPPDRCDGLERARERLHELAWAGAARPPEAELRELGSYFERDEYAAAERIARWNVILGGDLPEPLRRRAERALRERGGAALADRVFGMEHPSGLPGAGSPTDALRQLRAASAAAIAGEEPPSPLEAFGLTGLALFDSEAREVLRFGRLSEDPPRRRIDSGANVYELALSPPPPEIVFEAIAFLLETLLFRPPAVEPPSDFAEGWRRFGVVAADVSMEDPYRRLVRLAPAPVTVLIRGESGSGKEAVARAVHALSPRAPRTFVAVNVPAVPAALLESELFGHARGAFTGADRDRKGLIEEAEGGTIFFDEVGDLSQPLQAKLLRALQEREIRRVGENRPRRVDVRVVSATSRDLEREVEGGRFREDLYYRLHVAVIALPPLRERGRDIALLARYFLSRCAQDFGRGNLSFAAETLSILSAHDWPGNVRELQNAVSQAAALAAPGSLIGPELLPKTLRRRKPAEAEAGNYRARVDRHRRALVLDALERARGNRSRAARDLGLSRQALAYLIRELNVTVEPGARERQVESRSAAVAAPPRA